MVFGKNLLRELQGRVQQIERLGYVFGLLDISEKLEVLDEMNGQAPTLFVDPQRLFGRQARRIQIALVQKRSGQSMINFAKDDVSLAQMIL